MNTQQIDDIIIEYMNNVVNTPVSETPSITVRTDMFRPDGTVANSLIILKNNEARSNEKAK